ncbi:hypothetical protein FORC30_p140 (plasmid) [Salmonella enterica]|nr:hypothetical protein FORC30_p140 [Salmonella enterica]
MWYLWRYEQDLAGAAYSMTEQKTTGTDTETENGWGSAGPQPQNHY